MTCFFSAILEMNTKKKYQKYSSTTVHKRSFEVTFMSKNEPGDAIETIHQT